MVGEGDGGDVLELSRVKGAHEAEEIDDCADVGGVGPPPPSWCSWRG